MFLRNITEGKDGICRQQYSDACNWWAEGQAEGGSRGLRPWPRPLSKSGPGTQRLPPSTPCDTSLGRQERLVQYRQSGATPLASTGRLYLGYSLPGPPPPPERVGARRAVGWWLLPRLCPAGPRAPTFSSPHRQYES